MSEVVALCPAAGCVHASYDVRPAGHAVLQSVDMQRVVADTAVEEANGYATAEVKGAVRRLVPL